jgi:hypothetical protein
VGKTMANRTASGPTWSFVTAGSEAPPQAPSGLAATAVSSSRIDLSWNDVSGETEYRVERSPDGSNSWTQIASPSVNQTTYSDLLVSAQQTYYYRVRAVNSGGFSQYSGVVSATTPTPGPTPTPAPGAQAVAWTGLLNATASGGGVMHNGGGYYAMARSQQALSGPGYFEWTHDGEYCVVGLGGGDESASAGYSDLDFAFQLYPRGYVVRQGPAYRAEGGAAPGDVFRIELAANGDVLFKRNGVTAYAAPNPAKVFPYYLVFKTQEVTGNSISGALAGP